MSSAFQFSCVELLVVHDDETAEDLMEKIRKHDDVQRKSPSPADQKWIAEEAVRSGVTLDAQAWSPITKGAGGCADPPSGWGVHAVQPQGRCTGKNCKT